MLLYIGLIQKILIRLEKYPSGRRGSPAKGVVRVTAARVQISISPPTKRDRFYTYLFLFIMEYKSRFDGGENRGNDLSAYEGKSITEDYIAD